MSMDHAHAPRAVLSGPLEDLTNQICDVERGHGARARVVDEDLGGYAAVLEDRGWVVARIEPRAGQGLRELVVDALQLPVANLVRPGSSARVAAAERTLRAFAGPLATDHPRPAQDPHLEEDLHGLLLVLVQAAALEGVALALLIENAGDLGATDLGVVVALAAQAESARWPLQVILAGLHTG